MQTRMILKRLTWTAALAFVLVFGATLVVQLVTTLAALVTDLGERLVAAGKVAQAAVVEAGAVIDAETPPMPTGYRTRDMAWSTR